jgi:hypothetical protein
VQYRFICIRDVPDSNFVRDTDYPETFRDFLQSFEADSEIVPLLGGNHFLPNSVITVELGYNVIKGT